MTCAIIIYSNDASLGINDPIARTSIFVFESYENVAIHHDTNQRIVTCYNDGTVQLVVTGVNTWRRDNDWKPVGGEEARGESHDG